MELRELISGEVETISGDATVFDAAVRMQDARIGSLAVVDDDEFSGIFTERDVLRAVADGGDPSGETVVEWMTMYPDSFMPDMDVDEAADWMLASGYRHLPVIDGGKLVGMASIKDILWALAGDTAK
jgi:CBS domain-containing protein